jgi:ABC-type antimicrobial peptide transport system permease subunit
VTLLIDPAIGVDHCCESAPCRCDCFAPGHGHDRARVPEQRRGPGPNTPPKQALQLVLAVLVSLFGTVSTLVLSVFERTREIGMLRAVGTTRVQVRRMIRHESIITALIGAAVGLPLGLALAALVTRALESEGIGFHLPVTRLAVFTLVAVLASALAAILPARRASRLNVLEALQYE